MRLFAGLIAAVAALALGLALTVSAVHALAPPAPEDVPPLAEGAQECVRSSLVENSAGINVSSSIWRFKGPGAPKREPSRRMRVGFSDHAGNPGHRDMSCVGYLDASPTTDIWLERRKKGSKKPRRVGSDVKTVTTPIDLLRTDIFNRAVTLKLNYQPVLGRDDWVLKTKECADPVGGEIECRTRTWKWRRITALGPVT